MSKVRKGHFRVHVCVQAAFPCERRVFKRGLHSAESQKPSLRIVCPANAAILDDTCRNCLHTGARVTFRALKKKEKNERGTGGKKKERSFRKNVDGIRHSK